MQTILLDEGEYKRNHFRLDVEGESNLPQRVEIRKSLGGGMYGGRTKAVVYQKTDRKINGCRVYNYAYVASFPVPGAETIF